MNLNNLKITDGDLVIVQLDEDASMNFIETVREKLTKWCAKKGISNVEFMITTSKFNVTKFTVNDVAENALLKD